jgi:hypothetical protein
MKYFLSSFFIIITFVTHSLADSLKQQLEDQYINNLKDWIKKGSRDSNDIKYEVQAPCSKLVILMATPKEQEDFLSHARIDDYDFRASFCMSAVVSNVWPDQPGLTKKFKKKTCREKIPLIKRVCKEFL